MSNLGSQQGDEMPDTPELIALNLKQLYENQETHKESILRLKVHVDSLVIVATTFFIINFMISMLSIACLLFTLSFLVYTGTVSHLLRISSEIMAFVGLSPLLLLKKSFVFLRRKIETKVATWMNEYQGKHFGNEQVKPHS